MRSAGVADLLAIATVRRLLLEMGCDLQPGAETVLTTPLSFWIREPRSEWNGRTAVEIIGEPDGEALLRQCLLALIESRSAT